MADEKRQIILDLLMRNKTRKEVNDAASDLDKLGKSVDDVDKKTKGLGKSSEETGKGVTKLGHDLGDTERRISSLSKEIDISDRELVSLAKSFATASNAGERLDISKAIRRTENDIRRFGKSKSILEATLPDPGPAVRTWAQNFGQSLAASGADIAGTAGGSSGIVIGAAIGAAATPVIIGAISTAVSAGVGAGLIGIGAYLLKDDTKISGYAARIGKDFKDGITSQARGAFEGPILESLHKLESFTNRSVGKIGQMFSDVAPYVGHFTDSLIKAGDIIIDTFEGVASKSGPALDALGDSIVLLTDGTGKFITALTSGGPNAAADLTLIAGAMSDVIAQTGTFLGFIEKLADNEWFTGPLLPLLRDHYKDAAAATHETATATDDFTAAQERAKQATIDQGVAMKTLTDQLHAQTDPMFAVINAQREVKKAQDESNDAIDKYGYKSQQAKDASQKLALAALALQEASGKAGASFDGKLSPAMYATFKAAGLTEAQIADIVAELKRAKAAAEKYEGNYNATFTTTYYSKYVGKYYSSANEAERDMNRRAAGGPVRRGVPYLVGEDGPEIAMFGQDGTMKNASETRRMLAGATTGGSPIAMGGGGMGAARGQRLELEVVGSDARLVSLFKYLIRTANLIEVSSNG